MNNRDRWATPCEFFDVVNGLYSLKLDVCANERNTKCPFWIDPRDDDALEISWRSKARAMCCWPRYWCNPPYSRGDGGIGAWIDKAYRETQHYDGCVCVMLLPDTYSSEWFLKLVHAATSIYLLKPRIDFVAPAGVRSATRNPRSSMLAVFRRKPKHHQAEIRLWEWRKEGEQ